MLPDPSIGIGVPAGAALQDREIARLTLSAMDTVTRKVRTVDGNEDTVYGVGSIMIGTHNGHPNGKAILSFNGSDEQTIASYNLSDVNCITDDNGAVTFWRNGSN